MMTISVSMSVFPDFSVNAATHLVRKLAKDCGVKLIGTEASLNVQMDALTDITVADV